MKRRSIVFCSLMALVALFMWVSGAQAYQFYSEDIGATGGCAQCHGAFRSGKYVSPADGAAWGVHLHAGHLNETTIGADCGNCHWGTGTSGRLTNLSSSQSAADGVNAISCSGCHGRLEDAGNGGLGVGLRLHHINAGVPADGNGQTCNGCHNDSAPVGEDVMPAWYGSITNNVTGTTLNPCNVNGAENFAGTAQGNDNDGDLAYDSADSDCSSGGDTTPPTFGGVVDCYSWPDGYIWMEWDWATDDTYELMDYNVYWSFVSGGQDFSTPNYTTWENFFMFTDNEGVILDVPYYFVVRAIDGSGNEETNTVECSATAKSDYDDDGYTFIGSGTGSQDDCHDFNPLINPGAVEDCTDGIDNDCDNLIDDQDPDAVGCISTTTTSTTTTVPATTTTTTLPPAVCGNGTVETGETCDDGAANGTTTCGCQSDCTYAPAATSCADGLYCNGDETCDGAGTCQAGTPVTCDDGVGCTEDFCDEAGDACVNIADNTNCPDDGSFCNGTEFCDEVNDCSSTGDPCLAGETCNETADTCEQSTCADHLAKDVCQADPNCEWVGNPRNGFCQDLPVSEPEICTDGVDNDLDELTDCDDPDCFGIDGCPIPSGCSAYTDKNSCNADSACSWNNGAKICEDAVTCVPDETPEATCTDGVDNDCDGMTDCADTADCGADPACQGGSCDTYTDKTSCQSNGCTWSNKDKVCM